VNIILILLAMTLAAFFATAWLLAFCAWLFNSPRGKFKIGLLAVLILSVTGLGIGLVGLYLQSLSSKPSITQLCVGLLQLVVVFMILKKLFALSLARSLALFGIYFFVSVAQVVFAILIFRPFVGEAFVLPTASMSPTLNAGDRILANKLEHPRRWDLTVYKVPGMSGASCKRIVGLPGEKLKFDQGNLFVNETLIPAPAVLAGRCHMPPACRYQDGESITLAGDEFFAIGDHVDLSYDSRYTGPAKVASLIGVADVLYWPISRFAVFR
jgi:signal peptidase I